MASSTQTDSSAELADLLPTVQLDVRQGSRTATYSIEGVDFLIGSVPGCDLRVAAADTPAVLCLLARHPAGVSLRKLAPTQVLLVNNQSITQRELADGDRVQIGSLEIQVHIAQRSAAARSHGSTQPQDWEMQLDERAAEIERQKTELTKVRQEMADLRRQLYDHYQERRDRLAQTQDDLEKIKRDLDEREKKLRLEEQDAAERRQRDRAKVEDIDRRAVDLTQRTVALEIDRQRLEGLARQTQEESTAKLADFDRREKASADQMRELDARVKQYEADVLRLNRQQGELEKLQAELQLRGAEIKRDSADLEEGLAHLDEWRVKLTAEADRLKVQKEEQDAAARQQAERAASLEGQQAILTILRGRLERMREEIRAREQQIDEQRARQDARDLELAARHAELEKRQHEMEVDREQHTRDRAHWTERSAVMDAAVRQLKEAQEKLAVEQERVSREAAEIEELRSKFTESDGVLQGRLAQLAETRERLDLERQALQQRSLNISQREDACAALQEQLHRRSEEIAARNKEITDQLQIYQAKAAGFDDRAKQLDQREQELKLQIETWRCELEQKAQALQQRHTQLASVDDEQREQLNQVAVERKAHAEERAAFHLEQQAALEKLTLARTELESLRGEALSFIQQLPDAELRAGAAVDRLASAREQLRHHLSEIHTYVRGCQEELEQLRGRLQGDFDKLQEQERTLRRNEDEHRVAAVAFRQQLIDWQGQIADLKRLLARDSTRLQRQQAETDERAKAIEVESQRLAEHSVQLQEAERDVAERREEIDRHLVDMRQWYRQKLREVAGIPLVPDFRKDDAQPTILQAPHLKSFAEAAGSESEEAGIVPTGRSILSISVALDQGDQKLGQILRSAQLIDGDTLTALLAEARRQRRSLRQVLLASGVITLYQLALIEAGNVNGLMLGPIRIIDRLRTNAHETVYRVFDPRRGVEAVLRHLAEADMNDAVRPDEFRSRFTQAMLNDSHLANTLEVMEISGRPAVMQEWLTGLPASDWPPLAAAPGVCYRLLTQAAQGLATAHQAGLVHGHLSDTLFLLTADGVLKICGLGEPPWLTGIQHDDEPTVRDDLRTLGNIASSWCTPSGVRKGPKTKPLPDALVSALFRLAADGEAGYQDVRELLDDLHKAADAIPPNAEAWDRLLKYVREHGAAEATLRQSA